ncbi:MAG: hypothetical protein IAI50_07495 [Candidatus Eremiobacteraeota bacterium]|nr:hypothetical protein [Candidatus Eremiobacteraeota bacterium]
MNRRTCIALVTSALTFFPVLAAAADTGTGMPKASEAAFVAKLSDLNARFPTPDAARKAGYIRFTDEDDTGAISYANRVWTSVDAAHPSQLWYDAKGRLIGADYSVPYDAAKPTLFNLDPSRWQRFGAHVHYGLVGPDGSTTYGATGAKMMTKVGSSVDHPTADALVAAGIAKKTSDVRFVFTFPAIWDVSVWVLPKPNGAFADKNPDVKPTNAKPMSM